jgi:hypothetical protein
MLGVRRTPVIFTTYVAAQYAVRNNEMDLADDNSYQYAVIEETFLDVIRPNTQNCRRSWFRYNHIIDEFEEIDNTKVPFKLLNLYGFGIG